MDHPDDPIRVGLFSGNNFQATVLADAFRQGLLDAGKRDGKHGFFYTLSADLGDEQAPKVRVKVSGTDIEIFGRETGGRIFVIRLCLASRVDPSNERNK